MRDTGNEVEMCHTILQDAAQKDQFRYNKVQPEPINRPQHEAMGNNYSLWGLFPESRLLF